MPGGMYLRILLPVEPRVTLSIPNIDEIPR